jgi:MoxR-like ATPase
MDHVAVMRNIVDNVEKVIVGKRRAIELTLTALICRGHVLIEDVPGVGKTSMAFALAKSLNCSFRRIQFTPDIMPSDITGFSVYNPKTGDFEYKKGIVLSNVVLADEINRTSPKTQSSLLEAMEEAQVTVDGVTHKIDAPFIVLATQNPVEYLGTYPLPEAQMDRFFMRVSLGYPEKAEEVRMIYRFGASSPLETLEAVASGDDIIELQRVAEGVHVDERVAEYIVDLSRHTRGNDIAALGVSPRASLSLYKAAQAWALYSGRDFVTPDDVVEMCAHVLEHRVILKQAGKLRQFQQKDVISQALEGTKVPVV